MENHCVLKRVIATLAIAGMVSLAAVGDPFSAEEQPAERATIEIPQSIQIEHEAIHSTLVEATKVAGSVGAAAAELADVLHPHFVREEEIALPPLGLLAPLASGTAIPEAALSDALTMTDALRSELPRMLEEHGRIRAAVEKLGAAARAAKLPKYEQLAEDLALHAQTEEQVLYPAAILVGDIIRARGQTK
jgi:hypothetical protein